MNLLFSPKEEKWFFLTQDQHKCNECKGELKHNGFYLIHFFKEKIFKSYLFCAKCIGASNRLSKKYSLAHEHLDVLFREPGEHIPSDCSPRFPSQALLGSSSSTFEAADQALSGGDGCLHVVDRTKFANRVDHEAIEQVRQNRIEWEKRKQELSSVPSVKEGCNIIDKLTSAEPVLPVHKKKLLEVKKNGNNARKPTKNTSV